MYGTPPPVKVPGRKDDSEKPIAGVLSEFGRALEEVTKVATFGAKKYERSSWKAVPNGYIRYKDAMWRHLLKEDRHPYDEESEQLHAAHVAWNALARLELMLKEGAGMKSSRIGDATPYNPVQTVEDKSWTSS